MFFNSLDFAVFLPIVFAAYWLLNEKNVRLQNMLIVVSSYVFYGWWDWRFLSLVLFSTLVDYTVGLGLMRQDAPAKRKALLWTSIVINLGFLGVFKYYNFFLDNFAAAFSFFGADIQVGALEIILPVGISFYTFQTLSYTIDVYKGRLEPTTDFVAFAAYVTFFPQLVAGPIERSTHLLPQFTRQRHFDYAKAVDGLRQILWGLFKKIVIADNCGAHANFIFNHSDDYSGITLVLGALFFTFQIYGDFSGYSDIAIGTSRLFGFDLMRNFNFPYFSRDIAEFWRRWHISLSTWFRDYLYIPLGGSKGGTWMSVRNTFIVFVVSGFWHGANWTFIVWGLLNALYFLPLLLSKRNRSHLDTVAHGRRLPSLGEFGKMLLTFGLTVFAWIFFRAENIGHALSYIRDMLRGLADKQGYVDAFNLMHWEFGYAIVGLLLLFVWIEWMGRERQFAIQDLLLEKSRAYRYAFYVSLICCLFWFSGSTQEFIYFQF